METEMIGRKFGRLTVVRYLGKNKYRAKLYECICECGNRKIARHYELNSGRTKSCGCLTKESAVKHGHAGDNRETPTYNSWKCLKNRCLRKKTVGYENYGGRGIKVCERWMKFENFLADMGERPEGTTIDRINDNGDYCKENCRWATPERQSCNKRNSKIVEFNGETKSVAEWARLYGFARHILYQRLKMGWTIEKALTTPISRKATT